MDTLNREGLARYLQMRTQRGIRLRPKFLVISCCDFFVDPHLLTGARPGEMLQIQTPGNIVSPLSVSPTGEAATIEMAVTEFEVRDVIVLGHSPCRCMTNLISSDLLQAMPQMKDWMRYAAATSEIVQNKYPERTAYARAELAAEENVLVQLNNLKTHPSVAAALAMEQCQLHGWLYRNGTGDLATYVPKQHRFVSMNDMTAAQSANGPDVGLAYPS